MAWFMSAKVWPSAPDVNSVARNVRSDARDVEVPDRKLDATQSRIYTFASSRKEGGI